MKRIKLLKTILIPTLGISTITPVVITATSCAISVTGVKLIEKDISLCIGETNKLNATVLPEEATNKDVTWYSSNTSVASVDQNGTVKGVGKGNAVITVKTNSGGFKATCQVTVNEYIHVQSVRLSKHNVTIIHRQTETLTAIVLPINAFDKSVTWASSDESVASVDQNGKITAVEVGTAVITVTTTDGEFKDTCDITVVPIPVESVEINRKNIALGEGDSKTLKATILPENAADKKVTWTSSNNEAVTVDSTGKITGVAAGEADITVKTNDGGKTDVCHVFVLEKSLLKYQCIIAKEDSTLELENIGDNQPNLRYSFDGKNWSTYHTKLLIGANKILYLKGDNPDGWSHSYSKYSSFNIQGNVFVGGNIMALLDNGAGPGEEGNIANIPNAYCFTSLFVNCDGITNVDEDFLPATNLASYCYYNMFYNCISLTEVPKLSATELVDHCCSYMFSECKSLKVAPELPATTLAEMCYSNMFEGCSALTRAPELPAETLAYSCYWNMFKYCTSLEVSCVLPATTLAPLCYNSMFQGCSKMNSIKIAYTGAVKETPTSAFDNWVTDVAESGTFYYKGSDTLENFGFPSGWVIDPNW